MKALSAISFRAKVTLAGMITTVLALGVTGTVISVFHWRNDRQTFIDRAHIEAGMLGLALVPAIEYRELDEGALDEALKHVAAQPMVIAATVVVDGEPLVAYQARGVAHAHDLVCDPGEAVFTAHCMHLNQSLRREDGIEIGQLHMVYDTAQPHADLARSLAITFSAVGGSVLLVLLVGGRILQFALQPVSDLVDATTRIADSRDYTIRAVKHADDELGRLTDAFNAMLDEIEARDQELKESNDELERRVQLRTRDLERAKDQAEAAARAKSDFLANMSHEIRTPMTAILGYSDLLADERAEPDERTDCVRTIQRNGRHLLAVINDILDISKLESGRMPVEFIPTDVRRVLADVIDLMRVRAEGAGIGLELRWDSPLPSMVLIDPTRLRQVLINLVGNAIKFTERGRVTIAVTWTPPGDDSDGRLAIAVIDTGIGIAPDAIGRLFSAFTQADNSMSRRFGGTGLGLAISRRLADLMGGDIDVTSTLGEGSTFTVRVAAPLAEGATVDIASALPESRRPEEPLSSAVETQHAAEAAAGELAEAPRSATTIPNPKLDKLDCRVLLAEDGPDNQRLIMFHLKRMGCTATLAENGQEAVDLFAAARDRGEPFEVVLCDMQMPVKDGYTAVRELRDLGWDGPIVALTAHAMQGDRERCLDAGCDEYMTKPVDWAALRELIARARSSAISGTTRPAWP